MSAKLDGLLPPLPNRKLIMDNLDSSFGKESLASHTPAIPQKEEFSWTPPTLR